jgi:hypothetical protein
VSLTRKDLYGFQENGSDSSLPSLDIPNSQ